MVGRKFVNSFYLLKKGNYKTRYEYLLAFEQVLVTSLSKKPFKSYKKTFFFFKAHKPFLLMSCLQQL